MCMRCYLCNVHSARGFESIINYRVLFCGEKCSQLIY